MRRIRWVEPGDDGVTPVVQTITEREILEQYYPWWIAQMRKAGKAAEISFDHCVEDFLVVHWAEEVP